MTGLYSIHSGRQRNGDCFAIESHSPLLRPEYLHLEKRPEGADSGQRDRRQLNWLSCLYISLLSSLTLSGCGSAAATNTGTSSPSGDAALVALACNAGSMTGAGTDTCTATLNSAAGKGGQAVSLSSNDTAMVVPASAIVAAGSRSVSFSATISAVSTAQTASLSASSGGRTKTYGIDLGAAVPTLTLQSQSVPFGDVTDGSPAYQWVTLTSSGTAAVTVSAGSVIGTGYTISGVSFPLTLDPDQTETLEIEFDPTAPGVSDGAVTLTSNSSTGATSTISLSGTGKTLSHKVVLTWDAPTDSSDPVAGYNVYRAISGSSAYELLNSSLDGTTTYTDATVQNATAYDYYVEGVDDEGNQSVPSNEFSVTIP
jgi:hypothetical protein